MNLEPRTLSLSNKGFYLITSQFSVEDDPALNSTSLNTPVASEPT